MHSSECCHYVCNYLFITNLCGSFCFGNVILKFVIFIFGTIGRHLSLQYRFCVHMCNINLLMSIMYIHVHIYLYVYIYHTCCKSRNFTKNEKSLSDYGTLSSKTKNSL